MMMTVDIVEEGKVLLVFRMKYSIWAAILLAILTRLQNLL